jgi:CheY-like chemotaxis protein
LVQRAVLSPPRLREALELQRTSGNRLATECLSRGFAAEEDLLAALSAQVGVPGIQLSRLVLPLAVLDLVPESAAVKQQALPVRADSERLFLAMANPNDTELISEVAFLSSRQIFPCVALAGALRKTIAEAYAAKKRGELNYLGVDASESDVSQDPSGLVYPRELATVPAELLRPIGRSAAAATDAATPAAVPVRAPASAAPPAAVPVRAPASASPQPAVPARAPASTAVPPPVPVRAPTSAAPVRAPTGTAAPPAVPVRAPTSAAPVRAPTGAAAPPAVPVHAATGATPSAVPVRAATGAAAPPPPSEASVAARSGTRQHAPIVAGATADIIIEVDDGAPGDLIIPFEVDDDLLLDQVFAETTPAPLPAAPTPAAVPPPVAPASRPAAATATGQPAAPATAGRTPSLTSTPAARSRPTAEPKAAAPKAAVRVLVVDDDPELRRLVCRVLLGKGMQVEEASRGLEALNHIKSSPPDLILLDAMLPEMHGFDICRKIKSSERYGHIPVIMISSIYRGWRIARDLQENYGVAAFLEKPFTIDMLWNTVERVLVSWTREPQARTTAEAEERYREAVRRFKANDIDGAIESCREGLRWDPLSAKLHYRLGILSLKKQGLLYQALQEFEEAIALDPDLFSALRTLAVLYQRKGFKNKAIDMWERALRCAPDDAARESIRAHLKTLF